MIAQLYLHSVQKLDNMAGALPLLARFVFAAVLAPYFWASALTKIGSFPFGLSLGAYAQIFPRAMEAAGFAPSALGLGHYLIALAGTYAEFLLPLAIILGLATRIAALGMMGFIAVQSAVDIWGHGAGAGTIGAWFDRDSAALIADQRALWFVLLAILVLRGAGALSLDRAIARHFGGVR